MNNFQNSLKQAIQMSSDMYGIILTDDANMSDVIKNHIKEKLKTTIFSAQPFSYNILISPKVSQLLDKTPKDVNLFFIYKTYYKKLHGSTNSTTVVAVTFAGIVGENPYFSFFTKTAGNVNFEFLDPRFIANMIDYKFSKNNYISELYTKVIKKLIDGQSVYYVGEELARVHFYRNDVMNTDYMICFYKYLAFPLILSYNYVNQRESIKFKNVIASFDLGGNN